MDGRIPALAILGAALIAGGGIWYAQEYGFYDRLDPDGVALTIWTGEARYISATDIQAIDADSSPIRWRACFQLTGPLPETAQPFPDPTPLVGPNWFDCFDAARIGADLQSGLAQAYLAQPEIRPDVDRVIAIYPDGRGYGWQQFNDKTPERGVMD